jgi:RNA-splicing ligase RtcB
LLGLIHVFAQSDLHLGAKLPIGTIFVSKGWIHSPLIGGDIGCGMAWYRTKLSRNQVDGEKGRKAAEKLRGLEGPISSAGNEWDGSLGTIGAGNHFAEFKLLNPHP